MTKKPREGVYHATVTSIGNDFFSAGLKRMERTNPAELAINLVNLCAEQMLGLMHDDPEDDHNKRDFFMAVGMVLMTMAQPMDKCLYRPLKSTIDHWQEALNDWEQDEKKFEAKKAELSFETENIVEAYKDFALELKALWEMLVKLHEKTTNEITDDVKKEIHDLLQETVKEITEKLKVKSSGEAE